MGYSPFVLLHNYFIMDQSLLLSFFVSCLISDGYLALSLSGKILFLGTFLTGIYCWGVPAFWHTGAWSTTVIAKIWEFLYRSRVGCDPKYFLMLLPSRKCSLGLSPSSICGHSLSLSPGNCSRQVTGMGKITWNIFLPLWTLILNSSYG